MRVAGIIAEYNPFHNGHAYHIAETRRRTGCDAVVAVMDGAFTQRGEAARLSKWTRTRMALMGGADAVLELPALYAVRPAEIFAAAGVAILAGVGADILSFGLDFPEADGHDPVGLLYALAELREREPEDFARALRRRLDEGMPHARAWGETAAAHLGLDPELLRRPNAILAVEYVRALRRQGADMALCPVPRKGDYHDPALGAFASASAIRAALAAGDPRAAEAVPADMRALLREASGDHGLDDVLLDRLRGCAPAELAALPDVSEGLERRLARLCREADGREALLGALRCRRYTQARLSRTLAQGMLGIRRDLAEAHPRPGYARVLGLRRGAGPLIEALRSRATLPLVFRPAELRDDPVFRLECRATDTWALGRNAPAERRAGRDFTEKFVVV